MTLAGDATGVTGGEPAADVIRRIAGELRALHAQASRIDQAIGNLLPAKPATAPHRDLQSVDALGQHLECLARFADGMAAQMPSEWHLDPAPAAAALDLRDLAARLSTPRAAGPGKPGPAHGDCAFF